MSQPVNTNIPAPRVEFARQERLQDGTVVYRVTREWYLFLFNLFNLTGAGNSSLTIQDLAVGPAADALGDLPNLGPETQLAAMMARSDDMLSLIQGAYLNPATPLVIIPDDLTPRDELGTIASQQASRVSITGGVISIDAFSLKGGTSGTVTVAVPAVAGANTLTLPAGTTDFSATGGTGQVVQQVSAGAALTVGQLATTSLSDTTAPTSFTPGISFGGGTTGITYSIQSGTYTRSGKALTYQLRIVLTSKGSSTGNCLITGLPVASATTEHGSFTLAGGNFDASVASLQLEGANTETNLYPYSFAAGAQTRLADTHFANNTFLYASGSYFTA